MPPLVQVKMQLKNNGINVQLQQLARNSRRLPDDLANYACNRISYNAFLKMPKVPIATMDQELEVQSQPVTKAFHKSDGLRGGLSKAKNPQWRNIVAHSSSLASRIVLASFYPNSPFNRRTGNVFQRVKPATHGVAAFWEYIGNASARMVKARHSSSGFFKACARAVNVGYGIVLGKINGVRWIPSSASGGGDINKISKMLAKKLAHITPAVNGSGRAAFSVSATEPDTKGNPGGALQRIAQPVWQAGVDEYALHLMKRDAERAYRQAITESGITIR